MDEPGNEQETRTDPAEGHGISRRTLLGGAAAGGAGLAAAVLQASRARDAVAGTLAQVEPPAVFFQLEVGQITGFFTEVSGLGSENEIIEQKVGDKPGTLMKSPGMLKWNDITLKRGATTNLDLYEWRRLQEDSAKAVAKDGSVIMLDAAGAEVARWNFVAGWPSKVSVGLNKSLSDDVMIIEELVLVPERIQRAR